MLTSITGAPAKLFGGAKRGRRTSWGGSSACDPDGGRGAPDREAEEEPAAPHGHDAGPDRPPDRAAHTGRPTAGGVAVVAVDEDDRHGQEQQLEERPEHGDRWQERQEVVVVGAG